MPDADDWRGRARAKPSVPCSWSVSTKAVRVTAAGVVPADGVGDAVAEGPDAAVQAAQRAPAAMTATPPPAVREIPRRFIGYWLSGLRWGVTPQARIALSTVFLSRFRFL